jgi:hypothetical protein
MEKSVMMKSNISAPSYWLSPTLRTKINKGRIYSSIVFLGVIYTFGGLIPPSFQWVMEIVTVMSWITILTLDPTRLPDATATKINQLKAWKYHGLLLPFYFFMFGIMLFANPIHIKFITIPSVISLIVNASMIELYYRNNLQARLRHLGLSKILSICIQSIPFATYFYINSQSLLISSAAFILGNINGIIVYNTRSIYPNILITILFVFLCGN